MGCCSAGGHDGVRAKLLLLSSEIWFGCQGQMQWVTQDLTCLLNHK